MERLAELFCYGGPVMFAITGVSIFAWHLSLRTWWRAGSQLAHLERLRTLTSHVSPERVSTSKRDAGFSGALAGIREPGGRFAFEAQAERLEHVASVIGALAMGLPLLGLLGTVLGMLASFEVIRIHGAEQPRLLAGGVSQALLTTQAGLWTALPILFFRHAISNRVQLLRSEIELASHARNAPGPAMQLWHRDPVAGKASERARTMSREGNGV